MISQFRKGFTLVELMIVIAIIGILASALYPSFMSYLAHAEDTRTRVKMLRIAGAFEAYTIANDTWIMVDAYGGGSGSIDYDPTLVLGPTIISTAYAAGEPSAIRKLELAGYLPTGYIVQTNNIANSKYAIHGCDSKTFSIGSSVNTQNKTDITELSYACNGVINALGISNTMATDVYHPMNTAATRGVCISARGDDKNCEGLTLPSGGGYAIGDLPPSGYCWMIPSGIQPYVTGITEVPTFQVGAVAVDSSGYYDGSSCTYSCGGGMACS